jgi:hypothetical protein
MTVMWGGRWVVLPGHSPSTFTPLSHVVIFKAPWSLAFFHSSTVPRFHSSTPLASSLLILAGSLKTSEAGIRALLCLETSAGLGEAFPISVAVGIHPDRHGCCLGSTNTGSQFVAQQLWICPVGGGLRALLTLFPQRLISRMQMTLSITTTSQPAKQRLKGSGDTRDEQAQPPWSSLLTHLSSSRHNATPCKPPLAVTFIGHRGPGDIQ